MSDYISKPGESPRMIVALLGCKSDSFLAEVWTLLGQRMLKSDGRILAVWQSLESMDQSLLLRVAQANASGSTSAATLTLRTYLDCNGGWARADGLANVGVLRLCVDESKPESRPLMPIPYEPTPLGWAALLLGGLVT
jgi:hypothetical protein